MICVIVKAFKTTDIVPMATSLRAYREFRKSLLANDKTGLEQMTVTGEIIGPHAGTTVRVLEVSVTDDRAEVRIESGEYAGTRAWTTMSWLNRISN